MTADSRCPTGVTCVWEGEAKCQVSVTLKGVASETVFTVNGASGGHPVGGDAAEGCCDTTAKPRSHAARPR